MSGHCGGMRPRFRSCSFPWTIWPRLWRAVARLRPSVDLGFRFCLCWFVAALVVLTMFSGKQPHYVLPLLPALALIAARACEPRTRRHARTQAPRAELGVRADGSDAGRC